MDHNLTSSYESDSFYDHVIILRDCRIVREQQTNALQQDPHLEIAPQSSAHTRASGELAPLVNHSYLLRPVVRSPMKQIGAFLRSLSVLLLASLVFQACNAVNPLCGSARPAPIIGSLSATTITLAEVQQGFVLNVYGAKFVSSSVVVINGTKLSTVVTSSTQLQVTITSALISAPGSASVTVNTPSGNSGDVGCSSGGTSDALVLTIT